MIIARVAAAIFCAALGLAPPGPAHAQPFEGRAALLVADPDLGTDPIYARSVLLVAAGPNGFHIGLIINRPTERSLASLFPAHAPSRGVKTNVYFGGPMSGNVLVALVRRDHSPGRQALALTEGLYLAFASETVDSVIEATPDDARFFVGMVIWQPGELEEELKRGFWTVRDPELRQVFRTDPEEMWMEFQQRRRGLSARLQQP